MCTTRLTLLGPPQNTEFYKFLTGYLYWYVITISFYHHVFVAVSTMQKCCVCMSILLQFALLRSYSYHDISCEYMQDVSQN
jgi:hypothetical protein